MEKNVFETQVGGKIVKVEMGALAIQASGACLVKMGETTVLTTAQLGQSREEMGFFPLTCEYEERFYAAGKILGSRFVRREGRPTTEATLTARMIDRTIRPLFPEGLTNEIQVISTCLSWDTENDPDVLGIMAASLALSCSEIPWQGPLGAVRVGKVGDNLIINPTYTEREQSSIDLVLSGHFKPGKENEVLVNMLDGKFSEATEDELEKVYDFAIPFLKEQLEFQKKIIEKIGKAKIALKTLGVGDEAGKIAKKILNEKLEKVLYTVDKKDRQSQLADLQEEVKQLVIAGVGEKFGKEANLIFDRELEKMMKENIMKKEKRVDGRKIDEVRKIEVEVGLLPRTHGSAVFTRGETKVLSIVTLGSPADHLMQDGMEISGKKRFMLHYNFPPYSVGEVKRMVGPGRREIGHGMLAEKTLLPMIPVFDSFPYTIRLVSEVVSSNGSSSMGSASSACMALMDAGVPIERSVAGIAIGLCRDKENYKIITDIQGPEDHYGEMDFKVAGTSLGVNVLQMDVKGEGITKEIFTEALQRGKKARLEILATQAQVLAKPRENLSPYAPRVYILQINPAKIGLVIGTGGKTINEIIEKCGVAIDIEEDGKVFITSVSEENANQALAWVKGLTHEAVVGEVFEGIVKKITDFGAFVEISPGQDGLVHVSELAPYRVERVEDVLRVGDKIPVKVIGVDEFNGKVSLSAKDAGFAPKQKPLSQRNFEESSRGRSFDRDRRESRRPDKPSFFKRRPR